MTDYLFVNPFLHPPGGGEGVANWMIEALASRGQVTVLTWDPPDYEEIDRYYGTSLSRCGIVTLTVAPLARRILMALGVPHHLLKIQWLSRKAKSMRSQFRHCFSAFNELDLGPPAVQYIHHPNPLEAALPSCPWPESRIGRASWWLYVKALALWGRSDVQNVRANITVANSRWTGRAYRGMYQAPVHRVIYPPPLGDSKADSTAPRREAFLTIARLDRFKHWPQLVEIIAAVRELGHDVTLTLAGSRYDEDFLTEIRQLVSRHADWLSLQLDQPRDVLDRLISEHKYAIHGTIDEHYGMAVAELVLGGCLTFVHDSGGQVEIVTSPETRYADKDEAVGKIHLLLSSPELRRRVMMTQTKRRDAITRERFLSQMNKLIDDLEAARIFQPESLLESSEPESSLKP